MRALPLIALSLLVPAFGCASSFGEDSAGLSAVERADCVKSGGEVRKVGMAGALACVKPYADAGKACSTKSDCLGRCLAESPSPGQAWLQAGEPATGRCEATNSTFGCFTEVDEGKAKPALCVD